MVGIKGRQFLKIRVKYVGIAMKKCRRCKRVRPSSLFGKNRGKCNPCRNELQHEYYRNNTEKIQAGIKKYFLANKKRIRTQRDAWLQENRPLYAQKINARARVVYAIKTGKLKRLPCQVCGSPEVHGHHTDYAKPLNVIWLCQKHHQEEHKRVHLSH